MHLFQLLVIIVIGLLILACLVVLLRIKPEDAPKAPPYQKKETADDRTHFYQAVSPGRALPPVPSNKRAAQRTDTAFLPRQ